MRSKTKKSCPVSEEELGNPSANALAQKNGAIPSPDRANDSKEGIRRYFVLIRANLMTGGDSQESKTRRRPEHNAH